MIWVNSAVARPQNLTAYDAWYVALAESLGATLATVDLRLTHATGPRCAFATPPAAR
jgi:predicted nucleic acid-binding protein